MAFSGYFAGEAGGFGTTGKVKRKDVEDVAEEFSEFSLSAPARKIRRLDVVLSPILEEEEAATPFHFSEEEGSSATFSGAIDVEPSLPVNKERALVLYQGVPSPSLDSVISSNVSFRVSPNLINDFKEHFFRSRMANGEDGLTQEGDKAADMNSCLAVVPWVPSQVPGAANSTGEEAAINSLDEQMELEEDNVMDVEETMQQEAGGAEAGEIMTPGLQQWQQYCMASQVSTSAYGPTPVMWSR